MLCMYKLSYLLLLPLLHDADLPLVQQDPPGDLYEEGGHPGPKSHAQLLALHDLSVSLPLPLQLLVGGQGDQCCREERTGGGGGGGIVGGQGDQCCREERTGGGGGVLSEDRGISAVGRRGREGGGGIVGGQGDQCCREERTGGGGVLSEDRGISAVGRRGREEGYCRRTGGSVL